jgi:hypothetical protein
MSQINWPQVTFKYHDYFYGPFVEIRTKDADEWGEFLIRYYEKVGSDYELVESTPIWGNNWHELGIKFYMDWYIEILGFKNNKVVKVAWDKFDLFDRKVAIWLQHEDINFHHDALTVIEEFINKHKCHVTVVSDFAHSLSSPNKHISFMSMLTADEARAAYYAVYNVGVYAGEENTIRLAWDDMKNQPVYSANRYYYHTHHPRNVVKLKLSPKEITRDILFGYTTNTEHNPYYLSGKRILSSKEVWLP